MAIKYRDVNGKLVNEWMSHDERKKDPAAYQQYLMRKEKYDGRPRAGTDTTNVVKRLGNWVLIRAKFQNHWWRLALLEVKPGREPNKVFRIDERDKSITILKVWTKLSRGRTEKCSYNRALLKAEALMLDLARRRIDSAALLYAANYFDQTIWDID